MQEGGIIGGVFALEQPDGCPPTASVLSSWKGSAPAVYLFHNARSAIRYVIATLGPTRVWMPAYLCPGLAQSMRDLSAELRYFPLDRGLHPDTAFLERHLSSGDVVIGINYFGRPEAARLRAFVDAANGVTWIEDCAQTLQASGDHFGDLHVYSPRKLPGVPDGGVLVDCRGMLRPPTLRRVRDESFFRPYRMRSDDPEGRHRDEWYRAFQEAEAAMSPTDEAMCETTLQILEQTDIAAAVERRIDNYTYLHGELGDLALFPETPSGWAPLGFPLLTPHHEELWEHLRRHFVFAPRHWRDLPSPRETFVDEHRLADALLTLPCDRRYSSRDMQRLVSLVREICP